MELVYKEDNKENVKKDEVILQEDINEMLKWAD